jgi:hypothetical protein
VLHYAQRHLLSLDIYAHEIFCDCFVPLIVGLPYMFISSEIYIYKGRWNYRVFYIWNLFNSNFYCSCQSPIHYELSVQMSRSSGLMKLILQLCCAMVSFGIDYCISFIYFLFRNKILVGDFPWSLLPYFAVSTIIKNKC